MKASRLALLLIGLLATGPLLAAKPLDQECGIKNARTGSGNGFLIENPQNAYQRDINRLLRLEISDLMKVIGEVERKRLQLMRIKRSRQTYQLIQLDNASGVFKNGLKSNYISRVHFNFRNNRLHCLMLESIARPIYEPDKWTRKRVRLRFPGIESLELHSERKNMEILQDMANVDPKHQLTLLRRVTMSIKTALYSMDMEIAGFYENRNKKNEWQLDL